MRYEMNFGTLRSRASATARDGKVFRIALLGDFSARANRGELETGDALAKRKGHAVDVDNVDEVLGRMDLSLTLPVGDGSVEIEIGSIDDFHPDELCENLEFFEGLTSLRRRLDGSRWESAAKEMGEWAEGVRPKRKKKTKSRGSSVPVRRMSDFEKLVGRPTTKADAGSSDADDLVHSVVGPFVVESRDAAQDELIAKVDEAMASALRDILHHPDFQTVESVWRSVDLLTRRVETGGDLRITLYDVSAEELAADLASADSLEDTGIYRMLVEQPATDANAGGAFSVVAGLYTFEKTPPHADLLGRMAKVAGAGGFAFVSGISNEVVKEIKAEDEHELTREAWASLRSMPEARHVGLACPRFLLRMPYGERTEPIDPFDFEEFTARAGVSSLLWANGAVLPALMLALTYREQGLGSMRLGSVMAVGDMPYYWYTDEHGDQVPLPCTDRLITERLLTWLVSQGLMPVIGMRGRPEVKLGSFQSVGEGVLAGPWTPPDELPEPEPEPVEEADEAPDVSDDDEDVDVDDADDDADSDDDEEDDELSSLLASFGDDDDEDDDSEDEDDDAEDEDESEDDDEDMDPELAALLKDL